MATSPLARRRAVVRLVWRTIHAVHRRRRRRLSEAYEWVQRKLGIDLVTMQRLTGFHLRWRPPASLAERLSILAGAYGVVIEARQWR